MQIAKIHLDFNNNYVYGDLHVRGFPFHGDVQCAMWKIKRQQKWKTKQNKTNELKNWIKRSQIPSPMHRRVILFHVKRP